MGSEDSKREIKKAELSEQTANTDPFVQFEQWFEFAVESGISEVNAMTLATATIDGKPSARIVLLKEYDEKGFVFFTNYQGRKGEELGKNPNAALIIFWKELERQIRIEGMVEKVDEKTSDEYFQSRPMESQVSAAISPQSKVVPSRQYLEEKWVEFLKQNYSGKIARPDFWGGYRVIPNKIEFWQGRPNRLHDRILYTKDEMEWKIQRLAP